MKIMQCPNRIGDDGRLRKSGESWSCACQGWKSEPMLHLQFAPTLPNRQGITDFAKGLNTTDAMHKSQSTTGEVYEKANHGHRVSFFMLKFKHNRLLRT
jgi:hypothetical protein